MVDTNFHGHTAPTELESVADCANYKYVTPPGLK